MMDAAQKIIAQKFFKLKILESKGLAFQDLFERVMEKAEPDFRKVKPYGNEGDHKNDGFIPAKGTYYQVYAPEKPTEKDAAAAKKVQVDFAGLLAYWKGKFAVSEFYFVFNDGYLGKSPLLYTAIAKIRKKHPTIDTKVFYCSDLQRVFLSLSDVDIQEIIGIVPDATNIDVVDIGVLSEVVSHLLENEKPIDYDGSLKVPDFQEKITFNGLSRVVGGLLTLGSYQAFVLEEFFKQNQDSRDVLQKIFTRLYVESLQEISDENEDKNDLVFFQILKKSSQNNSKRIQEAILTLMASFFETCDIFKEPV